MSDYVIFEKKGFKLIKNVPFDLNVFYTVEFNNEILCYEKDFEKALSCYNCKLKLFRSLGLIST